MPDTWIAVEQRRYEPIQQSVLQRSRGADRGEESISRPAGQQRRDDGRLADRRSTGTGNPRAPLEERSKDELYNLAEQHDIKGRSRMNKTQLITAIRRRNGSDL